MEPTKRWNSCRLTIQADTGRVRWCVGKESTWKCKIKILAFIPIVLLTIIAIPIFYRLHSTSDKVEEGHTLQQDVVTTAYRDSEIFDNEDREILNSIKTSFIPNTQAPYGSGLKAEETRHKRDLSSATHSNYDLFTSDESSSLNNETLEGSETKILKLKIYNPSAEKVIHLDVDKTFKRDDFEKDLHYWKDKITKQEVRYKQAHIMQRYMNAEIDPCTDFYQFACGNWEKHNPIPPDKAGYDTFERLRESLDSVLRGILTEGESVEKDQHTQNENNQGPNIHPSDVNGTDPSMIFDRASDPFIKVKNLYKSCINEEIINERAETPLLDLIEKFGGWPVIDDSWNETQFDWLWLIAQLRLYNNDILISEWIGPDIKNSNQHIIQLDQTTLGLPTRDYFLEESNVKYLEAYRIYMITAANLLGAPIIKATQDADRMIDFETNLAMITASQYERRNLTEIYSRMTVGELQAKIPQIDWLTYMNMVMAAEIGPDEPIVCFCIKYLQDLIQLLSRTPPRTIANYILWRFVRHRMNNLDIRFLEAKQRFYFVLYGREQLPPRWQTCVAQVNSNMGLALGHLFVKKYYDEKSKNDTIRMTRDIQGAFYSILSNVQWLDGDTKLLAQMKIKAMQLRIGYPDYILDKDELARKYMNVKINENLYFENTLSILQLETVRNVRVSALTVRRRLSEERLSRRRPAVGPLITTSHRVQSLRFARNHADWTVEDWKRVVVGIRLDLTYSKIKSQVIRHLANNNNLQERLVVPGTIDDIRVIISEHLTHAEQSRLNTYVNRTIWNTPPAIVNAYYSRNKNQIMFPAGILQPPFYHRHFPRSLNYGGIGVVIGHEITHGFDDKGRLFDKEGNLQRWWKDSAIDAFHERSQCLIDQYNSYIVPEVGVAIDGINTQGENIADNGGIKQAYKAYMEWVKTNPHADESLPGISMSNKQLFFLNFAQVWCGVSRPEALRNKLKTAVHSPGRFRVIGTIRNSQDFSEAYQCPLGSPMNPREKCTIW